MYIVIIGFVLGPRTPRTPSPCIFHVQTIGELYTVHHTEIVCVCVRVPCFTYVEMRMDL